MYFLQLPGYNPKNGISTASHGRFPFISAMNGLFEPAKFFDYHSSFPFEQIIIDNKQIFYLSEPNLIKIFKNDVTGNNEIWIENTKPITQEYTFELRDLFYSGYSAGFENFNIELGPGFSSLSSVHQKEMLEQFMDYCQNDLYFEGFAIPELLHNLGYIQACLLRAFKEYKNITNLTIKFEGTNFSVSETGSLREPILTPTNTKILQKIPLKYPASDIKMIWSVLIDLPKARSLNLTPEFKEETDVIELLGGMFADISGEIALLPDSPHYFYELPLDYQPILYLLMHATYKLNYIYTRQSLEEYSKHLKATFSVFDTIELNYMPGNFTKKQAAAISVLKELPDSTYAKNALQILAKIPSYRITM